jgi:hypothetical protein
VCLFSPAQNSKQDLIEAQNDFSERRADKVSLFSRAAKRSFDLKRSNPGKRILILEVLRLAMLRF